MPNKNLLLQTRPSWLEDEVYFPLPEMIDSGATLHVQKDKSGLLRDTICRIPPVSVVCGTSNTQANIGGIKILTMASAHCSDTAFAMAVPKTIMPDLNVNSGIISPWPLISKGVRRLEDSGYTPYMSKVPPNTRLHNDYKNMAAYPTVLLSRSAKGPVFLKPVDPRKFKIVRDFFTGEIASVPKMIRHLKLSRFRNTAERDAVFAMVNSQPAFRRSSTIHVGSKKLVSNPKGQIQVCTIACAANKESLPGCLPNDVFEDFNWKIMCEKDEKLRQFILKRHHSDDCVVSPCAYELLHDLESNPSLVPIIHFLFLTWPCIGETVLRTKIAKYKDNAQTALFRDKNLLRRMVLALNRPPLVASELTSPHPDSFQNHVNAEQVMMDLRYSQTQCSPVVNAAFFGGYTSQPRWIRLWGDNSISDLTSFDLRRYECQHAQPIFDIMDHGRPKSKYANYADMTMVASSFTRKVYRDQFKFNRNRWKPCLQLGTGITYSDNAYVVATFCWRNPGRTFMGLRNGSFTRNLSIASYSGLRFPLLYRIAHNVSVYLKCQVCSGFHILITSDESKPITLDVSDAAFIFCLGYYKDGMLLCPDDDEPRELFCNPMLIRGDIQDYKLLPHLGYRITVVGVGSVPDAASHTKQVAALFNSVSPNRVAVSHSNLSKLEWVDQNGSLLRVPLAHYLGHFGNSATKGQNVYLCTGPVNVITSHPNTWIACPSESNTWIVRYLTAFENDKAKGLEILNKLHEILTTLEHNKLRGNAVTQGLTRMLYTAVRDLYYCKDSICLLTESNQPQEHYSNIASIVARLFSILEGDIGIKNQMPKIESSISLHTPNIIHLPSDYHSINTLSEAVSVEYVFPITNMDDFLDIDTDVRDDGREIEILDVDTDKRDSLTPIPSSEYPPMITDENCKEYKRRRLAATVLIKTYGFGPRQFDFLVSKHPDILGRVYGNHLNRLQIGDWRYCNFPAFAQQYMAGRTLVKSRSVSSKQYNKLETYYGAGQCFVIDAKEFTAKTRRGFYYVFLCVDLITGFWIDYYTKGQTAKEIIGLISYLNTTVKLRFGISVKLILWDQFVSFYANQVKQFAAVSGNELAGHPAYMKNRNLTEQAFGTLAVMIRFRCSWVHGHKAKGKLICPSKYADYATNNSVNCHNNSISTTYYRHCGQITTYLDAISGGKETVVPMYQFFGVCMSEATTNTEPHQSKNIASVYLSTCHYNPLKMYNLATHTGGVKEDDNSILLQLSTDTIVNSGKWLPPHRTTYGKFYALEHPNRNLIRASQSPMKHLVVAKKPAMPASLAPQKQLTLQPLQPQDDDSAEGSDEEDSPLPNTFPVNRASGKVVSANIANQGESPITMIAPPIDVDESLETDSAHGRRDDGLSDAESDGQSYDEPVDLSEAPDEVEPINQEPEEEPDDLDDDGNGGVPDLADGNESESDDEPEGPRYPSRTRGPPTMKGVVHPGGGLARKAKESALLTAHQRTVDKFKFLASNLKAEELPIAVWKSKESVEESAAAKALEGPELTLPALADLASYFTPSIWLNDDAIAAMNLENGDALVSCFLDELAQGRAINSKSLDAINYVHLPDDPDDDIAQNLEDAVCALWGGSPGCSSSTSPTPSQYLAVQRSGRQMCKLSENSHLFGQNLDMDERIYDCLMTYGLQPSASASSESGMKNVEIFLHIDQSISQVAHKSAVKVKLLPLKHSDIEYHQEKIADLNRESRDMRAAYFKAIQEEMNALCALGFAEVTIIPDDRDPISTRFVLKVKRKADGSFDRVKARLVVRGFMQRIGLDFYTSYSPMATLSSCRVVLATATHHKLPCWQLDIPSAFIQSKAERDMFIHLPPGLVLSEACRLDALKLDKDGNLKGKGPRVGLRLLKALYGLKQAPLLWNLRIDEFFKSHGFVRQAADACLYKYEETVNGEVKWILLSVSVDDILVTGNHFDRIEQLHKELNDAFSITINGKLKEVTCEKFVDSFLGILVTGRTENGSITLSVPGKINDLVKETETATGTKLHSIKLLSAPDKDSKPKSGKLYDHVKENFSRIIGCCIYMSITCRPDISTWVSRAARGMHSPEDSHIHLAIQLLMYLNGTQKRGLTFSHDKTPVQSMLSHYQENEGQEVKSELDGASCVAFSDANWCDPTDDKLRSTSGYCIYLFGCLISWHTKRQTLTAASTMQAELIAAATCADEVKWFSNFLKPNEAIFGKFKPIPLLVDNKAALSVANHPKVGKGSKFVDLREYRIRDYQIEGVIRPLWVPGNLNPSDLFTKLLGKTLFERNVRLLGMSMLKSDDELKEEVLCAYIMTSTPYQEYDLLDHYPSGVHFMFCPDLMDI